MQVYFDGCTEVLLQELRKLKPADRMKIDSLYESLAEFKNECIKNALCPSGEMIRGYMCRSFLRDAARRRMKDKLKDLNEDATIKNVLKDTYNLIEVLDEKTEAERAYIVARNLVIISQNIAEQQKKGALPIITEKPSLHIKTCKITKKGIDSFAAIMGFSIENDPSKLTHISNLPPMSAKTYCYTKYRHIFFNLVTYMINEKEVKHNVTLL